MPFMHIGERIGLQKGLEALLRVRFGKSGTKLMAKIRKIKSGETLEKLLQAAETAESISELQDLIAFK